MQNNNFAETLASVASEFGVEDTEKHGRGIKPSKRPYFRWTEEQLEQLATLRDEGKSAAEIAEALGVSRDKVITKLAAMAARRGLAARRRSKVPNRYPRPRQNRSRKLKPSCPSRPSRNQQKSRSSQAAPVDVDRMIFTAFDNVVGKVDDFVTMSGCWRKVLTSIEQQVREMQYLVEQHPNTEESVCQIAAIIAYDEVRA